MKRIIQAAAAAIFLSAMGLLGGCASTGTTATTVTSTASTVQSSVAKACPFLDIGMAAAKSLPVSAQVQTDVSDAQGFVDTLCAQNATIDTSSVGSLVNTSIPALIADVQASSMSQDAQTVAVVALNAAKAALQLQFPAAAPTTPATSSSTPAQ